MENFSVALYHQSTYSFSEVCRYSRHTYGLQKRTRIDYESEAILHTSVKLPSPFYSHFFLLILPTVPKAMTQTIFRILPKLSAKYKINDKYNVYSTIAKGYKAGGYNYAMFSDIPAQSQMEGTKQNIKDVIYYKPRSSTWNFKMLSTLNL